MDAQMDMQGPNGHALEIYGMHKDYDISIILWAKDNVISKMKIIYSVLSQKMTFEIIYIGSDLKMTFEIIYIVRFQKCQK